MNVRVLHLSCLLRQFLFIQVQLRTCVGLGTDVLYLVSQTIPLYFHCTNRGRVSEYTIVVALLLELSPQCFQAALLFLLLGEQGSEPRGKLLSGINLRLCVQDVT